MAPRTTPTTAPSTATAGQGILVGVDGSDESLAAVAWAAQEAMLRGSTVTLMHVISPMVVTWPIEPLEYAYAEWQDTNAQAVIERAQNALHAAVGDADPPPVRTRISHDGIVPELTAASADSSILVIGNRGLGPIGGAVLGSVCRSVLHHAHCPVAVVKVGPARGRDDGPRPVLLGVDGSPASDAATAFAFDEAARRGVPLVAMHAWCDVGVFGALGGDWATNEDLGHEILAERLAGWQDEYPDVAVQRRLVCDRPARWLIDESKNAQLVVVGSRGRGGIAGMLLGSVSTAVVEFSPTPVVIVRGAGGATSRAKKAPAEDH